VVNTNFIRSVENARISLGRYAYNGNEECKQGVVIIDDSGKLGNQGFPIKNERANKNGKSSARLAQNREQSNL